MTTALFPLPRTNLTGYRQIVAEDDSDDGDAALLVFQNYLDLLTRAAAVFPNHGDPLRFSREALESAFLTDWVNRAFGLPLNEFTELLGVAVAKHPPAKTRRPPVQLVVLVLLW